MGRAFILAAIAALTVGGCEQIDVGPRPAEPAAPPAAAVPNLRLLAGQPYQALLAEQDRYAPANLGLAETDAARLTRAMAEPAPAWIVAGGGMEAIVFSGCDAAGCAQGSAVVAIDLATGSPFVAVRDQVGRAELTAEDRVEALLRLNSPTRNWHDARPPRAPAPTQAGP